MLIKVSQAYLELARSYITASIASDVSQPDNYDQNNRATITFSLAALSTIFSYAAIEAFVNYELFHIWEHSREAHKIIENIQQSYPSHRYVAIFGDFYNKYGHIFPFNKLKSTCLRDLTERIKTICKVQRLPSLPQSNGKLWNNLLKLEETRHDLIHPIPDKKGFDEIVNRLFYTESYKLYPQTASDVIKFFFESAKRQPPDYLDDNKLFRITTIEVL
jgi:hypothetical protein